MLRRFITQAGTAHRPVRSGLADITPTLVTRIILMATRGASGVVITAEAGTLARTGEVAATTEGTIVADGRTDTDGAAGTGMIDRCRQNCQGLVPPATSERQVRLLGGIEAEEQREA